MPDQTVDTILTDINARLTALGERQMSDDKIREIIAAYMAESAEGDAEFVRKIRFGPQGAPRTLVGSKYARLGMSVGDIEFLYDLQSAARGMNFGESGRVHQGPSEELTNTFNALSNARFVTDQESREMDQGAIDSLFRNLAPSSYTDNRDAALAARGKYELTGAYKRAMDTAESGFGQQLTGQQYVGELWEAARRESRVFNLLDSFDMTAPTAFLPVEVDIPEALFVSESTANNSANYATSKTGSQRIQVDAKKFVIHQMWSGEMEEDSIIPFLPFLRRQATLSVAHFCDSAVLNGDTTNAATGNINLDDADPADTKHYLAYDGIRHAGLVDNTANSKDVAGGVSYGLLNGSKGRLLDTVGTRFQDWGHPSDMNDLVVLADPETADRLALMDEVITVDKYGPNATVLNGELARWSGHPVISTIAMSKTEADGKVSTTAANNTKGQLAVLNRRGYKVGWRRRLKVEMDRSALIGSDQTRIVWSMRKGLGRFSSTGLAGGIEHTDILFNVSL